MKGTALITGGSSGIGLEYARQLAARGYALVLVSNKADELQAAADELGASTLCQDLAKPGAAASVLEWCDKRGLSVDVLVCNAGMFFMEYLGADNLPKAQTMMALHMNATTELCVLFGERMKAAGHGHILIMSSMTDRIPAPGIAIYSSTKAYLKTFGLSLSYELRPYGVVVTTVCPAAVDTDLYPLKPGLRGFLKRIGIIKSPRWLVRRALRRMFRGCRVVRPGLSNYLVPLAVALMPARLIDHLGMKWINTKTL